MKLEKNTSGRCPMFFIHSLELFVFVIFIVFCAYTIMKQVYYIGYKDLAYGISKPSAWLKLFFWDILLSIGGILPIILLSKVLFLPTYMAKYAFRAEIVAILSGSLLVLAICWLGYCKCDSLWKTSLVEKLLMPKQNKINESLWQ